MIRSSHWMSGLGLVVALGLAGCGEPSALEVENDGPAYAVTGSSPIVCPTSTTRSVSAVIDRAGGSLELDGHRVTLPTKAVREPTKITLTVPASQYLELDLRANGLEHFQFDRPVAVTMSYARCNRGDVSQGRLDAWEIDRATGALLENMAGRDDKQDLTVDFTTEHFSLFAIAN